ncbi:MAG: alcohol dehydrogenase catalytic domain-containing protein [Nitrososphaerota archaeon]|nr:alcohol dehydrogenase catalytic domain-containing protein [Nitrososphaerota archaeon]
MALGRAGGIGYEVSAARAVRACLNRPGGDRGIRLKSIVLAPARGGHGYEPRRTESEAPRPGEGEVTVSMKACGLCGTDLEKIRGEYTASMPVVGHEAAGVVAELGEGAGGFSVGDRVFPHHHVPDYTCYLCRAGNETMCDHYRGSNLVPGGFSEVFAVPKWNVERGGVLKLPGNLSFEVASLIEPLACCVRAVRKCHVEPGESVFIAGAGPVGMMHALLLAPTSAKVVVSDVAEWRLRFAEKAGVGRVIDATAEDVPAQVRAETEGRGADVAMVASGSRAAILQGLRSVRKGGRVCIFGVPPKGSVLDYDVSDLYNAEREVQTSYGATETDTKGALRVLESRGAEFGALVTHRFPLDEFGKAVEAASGGTAMKVVVTP